MSVLDQRLSYLTVDPSLVPYDFSCSIPVLDTQNVMINPLGIQQESAEDSKGSDLELWLCNTCHPSIVRNKRPSESLANFRWIGSVPDELYL